MSARREEDPLVYIYIDRKGLGWGCPWYGRLTSVAQVSWGRYRGSLLPPRLNTAGIQYVERFCKTIANLESRLRIPTTLYETVAILVVLLVATIP